MKVRGSVKGQVITDRIVDLSSCYGVWVVKLTADRSGRGEQGAQKRDAIPTHYHVLLMSTAYLCKNTAYPVPVYGALKPH